MAGRRVEPSLQRRVAMRGASPAKARAAKVTTGTAITGSKRQRSEETRQKILDAAEALFARHGLYGVTVRNVADMAGVDTALIHYYFDTKLGLFEAVFERRSGSINQARLQAMKDYEEQCRARITVEGAVRAFLRPIFEEDRQADEGWRNYSQLVALANNSQEWGGEMMSRYFDHVIHRLIALLRLALPDAKEEDLYWSYQMLSGALMVIQASTGRIERLSGGLCRSDDVESFGDRLVEFASAGFRAVCDPSRWAAIADHVDSKNIH